MTSPAFSDTARGPGDRPRLVHLTTIDMSLALLLATELRHARENGYEVFGASAPGPYVERIEALGVHHLPLRSLTRSWNPVQDVRAFVELVRLLRRMRPDVLHTHNPKTGVMGRIAGRITRVPVVVNTCHGLWVRPDDAFPKRAAVLGLEALAARFSDYELFQNAQDHATMRRALKPGRHRVVGNGIDLTHFVPDPEGRARLRQEWGVGPEQILVGTVGRIVAEKGLAEFSEAAAALGEQARFVWVGPPDDAVGVPPLSKSVLFAGEHIDMPAVYAAFDVFVLASHREGFSRASMEAASCGKAMVLTDIRGCREIGVDGEDLLLVPPRDSASLTDAIRRLIHDPQLRTRFATRSQNRARRLFDQRAVAAISLATYSELSRRLPDRAQRQRRGD